MIFQGIFNVNGMCQLGIIILKIKQNLFKTAISYELISNLFSYFFSGLKTPYKKSKGHKAGISRWWSFRRKKHLNFLHLCWEVHLLQQENGCKLWRNLRQISPLPLQLYVFCKFFYHNGVRFFMKPYWIFHAQNFHKDVSSFVTVKDK